MLTSKLDLAQASAQQWDVIVVGGGITGAGILRQAVALGLKTVLLEQGDFASGTSSRSSKLVHGGLRYLSSGQIGLTASAVKERQLLLRDAPGLVEKLGFSFPVFQGQKPGLAVMRIGLGLYDVLAGQWQARKLSWDELHAYAPLLTTRDLQGVLYFDDARTDDARLVLRLIQEACAGGSDTNVAALNYCAVHELLREHGAGNGDGPGRVTGVLCQQADQAEYELHGKVVINASGAWGQKLGGDSAPRLRPLRGSHLLFKSSRVPLPTALSFLHPQDRRPVFAFEWEGAALLGTTDLDHADDLNREPRISEQEVDYLLAATARVWPALKLGREDVIASYAGVRPVVDGGAAKPSDESRESALWQEPGLVSVTGGKLTTFRLTAAKALDMAMRQVDGPKASRPGMGKRVFDTPSSCTQPQECDDKSWLRLQGRYGSALEAVLGCAQAGDFSRVANTPCLWLELRYAASAEAVQHLDDLLLRRTRLGLVLPNACRAEMARIREVCQAALGWDDRRWGNEEGAWYRRWQECYSLPKSTSPV